MRDGNVPRFFVRQSPAGETQLMGPLAAQLTAQLSSSQLFQLFMILLAREGRGERLEEGEEGGGDGRKWRGWKKMENYLLNK